MPGIWCKNVEAVRQIEWSKDHLWDVRFPDAYAPFNEWFPATDVQENLWTLNEETFESPYTNWAVPGNTALFNIDLTFTDDVKLAIQRWTSYWVNVEILGGDEFSLCPLEDALKDVFLVKFDNKGTILDGYPVKYRVFPRGSLYYSGKGEAQPLSDQLSFIIAGT